MPSKVSYFFDEAFGIEDEYPAEAAEDAKQILESTGEHGILQRIRGNR